MEATRSTSRRWEKKGREHGHILYHDEKSCLHFVHSLGITEHHSDSTSRGLSLSTRRKRIENKIWFTKQELKTQLNINSPLMVCNTWLLFSPIMSCPQLKSQLSLDTRLLVWPQCPQNNFKKTHIHTECLKYYMILVFRTQGFSAGKDFFCSLDKTTTFTKT